MSTEEMTAPATGVTWFNLARHDDPQPEGGSVEDPAAGASAGTGDEGDPEAERMLADALGDGDDPEGDEPDPESGEEPAKDALGDAGKKALERMKAERAAAKKEAAAAKKQAAELARKVQEFEDAKKSELERATAKAERAAEQAAKAVARAVAAEVKAVASGQFADPSDATDVLMRDPSKYVDADGDIDTDAIEADLADLLERKPHWAKPAPAPATPATEPEPARKPKPKPDPGQGSRGAPAPTDFSKASKDEVAEYLSQFGYRQRSA
jgi:hypothetical protein